MFSDQALFVSDVDDLKAIAANPHLKNLLHASAILRRLLMDALAVKAARGLDLKIKFRPLGAADDIKKIVDGMPVKEGLTHLYINRGLNVIGSGGNVSEMDLDQFLKCQCFFLHGTYLTIYDVIHYCANVGGGVHAGIPKKAEAILLHQNAANFVINGAPFPLEILRNLVDIVIEAMTPIYLRLRA